MHENSGKPIALIGMMGAGKSTVGRSLAKKLSRSFTDSDAEIEVRTGMTVATIFEKHGETAFREFEATVIREALCSDKPVVVGVAGGAVLRPGTQDLLRKHAHVVWLDAPIEMLIERVSRRRFARPLIKDDPDGAMQRLYAEREPVYAALVDDKINVIGLTPSQIAARILEGIPVAGVSR